MWLIQKNAVLIFNMLESLFKFAEAVSGFNFMDTHPTCSGPATSDSSLPCRNCSNGKKDFKEALEEVNLESRGKVMRNDERS